MTEVPYLGASLAWAIMETWQGVNLTDEGSLLRAYR